MSLESETVQEQVSRLVGMVKWFNNKAGYGFITVRDDVEQNGDDIFVHFSSIQVADSQYKYLVPGEYVEFVLEASETGDHKYHAQNVSGIRGGPILCETRRLIAESQPARRGPRDDVEDAEPEAPRAPKRTAPPARSTRTPSRQASVPEQSDNVDGEGFVKVQRRSAPRSKTSAPKK